MHRVGFKAHIFDRSSIDTKRNSKLHDIDLFAGIFFLPISLLLFSFLFSNERGRPQEKPILATKPNMEQFKIQHKKNEIK